jgi:hypothetical protein
MKAYRHYRGNGWPRHLALAMLFSLTEGWAVNRRYS